MLRHVGHRLEDRGYPDRAAQSVEEAIFVCGRTSRIFMRSCGSIYFEASKWNEALQCAEIGLKFDAEHTDCNNLRAMALVKLGRKAEAAATIDQEAPQGGAGRFVDARQYGLDVAVPVEPEAGR